MELHQLRYFVAAAEAGTVSRAAERCRVAQPSLSQQIKKLEESLGVVLFDRLGRGVALTDAGRALLPRARRVLAEVRDTEANLHRESEEGAGVVAIGAIPTMAPYLLPRALKRMLAGTGAKDVMIREALTEELVEALLDNQIDVAIVSTPVAHEHVEVRVIGSEELVVVVPAKHRLAERKNVGWSELRDEPIVTLTEMHCLGRQIQGFCSVRGVGTRVACRATQMGTIFELVGAGLGLSLAPEMAAAGVAAQRWRYLKLSPGKPTREVAVAWRRDRTKSRLAERLIRMVEEDLAAGRHGLKRG